ncbi:MAG: hypothetical protein R3F37_17420 [Candidatus Competibacteraceae bacterium]
MIFDDSLIHRLNADTSGLFVLSARQGSTLAPEQAGRSHCLAFEGPTLAEVHSPISGMLLTLREYPLVYEGSLLARVVAAAQELQ